jgi:uncharacterized tellurite resistance protein B-like protein
MSILRFLGLAGSDEPDGSRAAAGETETVRQIVDALDQLEPERAKFIATFAYVLSRVAHADLDISEEETRAMEKIVADKMELPAGQALLTVQIAKTQSRLFGGTENFVVTGEFAKLATHEQKLALLDCLFLVSAADDNISTVEDNEIAKIANELLLSHGDFIATRLRYKGQLGVLKKSSDRTDS